MKIRSGLQPAGIATDVNRPGSSRNQFRQAAEVIAHLTGGGSVLLTETDGAPAVLAVVAETLAKGRTRVLQVRPPLDLREFMGQVGRTGNASGDDDVERGFNALTILDPGCDRIVLLVEDAHLLPHRTLFYLQFVLRAEPPLQLAFAGRPEVAGVLALEGFTGLRGCFSLHLTVAAPAPGTAGSVALGRRYGRLRQMIAQVLARSAAYAGPWNTLVRPASAANSVLPSGAVANDIGSPMGKPLEEQSFRSHDQDVMSAVVPGCGAPLHGWPGLPSACAAGSPRPRG